MLGENQRPPSREKRTHPILLEENPTGKELGTSDSPLPSPHSTSPAPMGITHLGQGSPEQPPAQLGDPVGKEHHQVEASDQRGCQGHRRVEVSTTVTKAEGSLETKVWAGPQENVSQPAPQAGLAAPESRTLPE